VLQGKYPGRVFVDDPAHPQTAFMITRDSWCFMAGDADHDAFNRALNEALLYKKIVGEDVPMLLLHCHPEDWNGQLAVVFAPRPPIVFPRRRYVGRELSTTGAPTCPRVSPCNASTGRSWTARG